MEILIGVLVGIDVVFIGLFYVMRRKLITMKNRIKMTDIRLGKEHEVSLEQTEALNTVLDIVRELTVQISEIREDIETIHHEIDNLDNYLVLQKKGEIYES